METLKDFNFKNKRVLLRCDFQVPLDEKGNILDDFKIRATIPTIKYLIREKARVILMSHWKPAESQKKAESLKLILFTIAELLKKEVKFLDDCVGEKTEKEIKKMKPDEIVLLENLRAHKEEEQNNDGFARQLAKLGDIYINGNFKTQAPMKTSDLIKVSPGPIRLTIKNFNFQDIDTSFIIKARDTLKLKFRFRNK